MPITEFDHYTLRSKDAVASARFYEQALGLNVRDRPGFSVPAFIVSIGERQVVHGFQASAEMEAIFSRQQLDEWFTGRLQHVEFWATDLAGMRARLTAYGVTFQEKMLPDKHQVQMSDPDNIAVNLNFPLSEIKTA
jgi:catechol 2,3-dioxygenase-like lactoylglutathione lyase family enzyme